MRLAGEILILVALLISIGGAVIHRGVVSQLVASGGSDPAEMARAMELPFQSAQVALVFGLVGLVLILVALATSRSARDAP